MIRKIVISYFRSCKKVIIDHIGSLVVLVGRNGAGKTNILRAIEKAARSATARGGTFLRDSSYLDYPLKVSFELTLDEKVYRYAIETALVRRQRNGTQVFELIRKVDEWLELQDDKGRWRKLLRRKSNEIKLQRRKEPIQISPSAPCLPYLATFLPPTHSLLAHIEAVMGFLEGIQYYPMDEPNESPETGPLIQGDEYKNWLAKYEVSRQAGDSVTMRLLHLYLTDPEKFLAVRSILGEEELGIVDAILVGQQSIPDTKGTGDPSDKKRRFFYLDFLPGRQSGGGGRIFDFSSLSLGTRRVIRLITSLVFDEASVMLIEHPEDGIHSGLTKKLIVALRRHGGSGQLIISSHSLVMLNTLDPEEVRLVTMSDEITKLRPLSPSEIKGAHEYINEQGPLSKFLEYMQED